MNYNGAFNDGRVSRPTFSFSAPGSVALLLGRGEAGDAARVAAEADPHAPTQTGHRRNETRVPSADGTQINPILRCNADRTQTESDFLPATQTGHGQIQRRVPK